MYKSHGFSFRICRQFDYIVIDDRFTLLIWASMNTVQIYQYLPSVGKRLSVNTAYATVYNTMQCSGSLYCSTNKFLHCVFAHEIYY